MTHLVLHLTEGILCSNASCATSHTEPSSDDAALAHSRYEVAGRDGRLGDREDGDDVYEFGTGPDQYYTLAIGLRLPGR